MLNREHAGIAQERQVAAHRAMLRRHKGMYDYMVVHHPHDLELTWYCCSQAQWRTDVNDPMRGVLRGHYCNNRPWCVRCNDRETRRRVAAALTNAQRVVPKGKQPWIRRFVLTAPTGPGQWGWRAANNPEGMFQYAKEFLDWMFGSGIGGYLSLHYIGEDGPTKPHPHIDGFLVEQLVDGDGIRPLPRVHFNKAWQEERDEVMIRAAQRAYGGILAERGNFWLGHSKQGVVAIRPEILYQMREVMDPRKIRYGVEDPKKVGWTSYNGKGFKKVKWASVDEFEEGIARMGQVMHSWGGVGRGKQWHRGIGFMAKSAIKKTEAMVGGQKPDHWRGCICIVCRDLQPEEMPDVEQAVLQARAGIEPRTALRV